MQKGQRLVGPTICVDWRESPQTRLGITASRKYGNSPERNRFKRIVREAFRLALSDLPPSLDLHVVPRQRAKKASSATIRQELLSLLRGHAVKPRTE